jgi:phthiocerol/phenolphthiocerol synthesis type-I polyketide synthase E
LIRPWYLIPLAAPSAEGLEAVTSELRSRLMAGAATIAEVTAEHQRSVPSARFRRCVIGRSVTDLLSALERPRRSSVLTARTDHGAGRPLVFMFPGCGAEHSHMAADLYANDEVFRRDAELCAKLFEERIECDALDVIGAEPGTAVDSLRLELASLFTVEYALARFWLSLGIQPAALIGHSLGEYVAATVAEALSWPTPSRWCRSGRCSWPACRPERC